MQITLSEKDFEAMPPALRRALVDFLLAEHESMPVASAEPAKLVDGLLVLSRRHAIDLVREASFRPEGKQLLAALRAVAYGKGVAGPVRGEMMKALQAPDVQTLQNRLDRLDRIAQKATGSRTGRLWRYGAKARSLQMHRSSRQALREVLEELSHAGEHEEPLWE